MKPLPVLFALLFFISTGVSAADPPRAVVEHLPNLIDRPEEQP